MFAIGITAMMTKFFQSQFGMPSSRVAYLTGPIALVGGGFGAVMGGALVSRWNLDYLGIMRLCMYNCCFSLFGVLTFLFYCQENTYATPEGFVGAPPNQLTNCQLFHMYSECMCVNETLVSVPGVSDEEVLLAAVQATRSRCPVDCALLYPYLLGVFLALSSTFLNAAPSTAASIRCVKPAERSLALGVKTIIIRLVGSIPAPVIFGGIVDQSCLTWKRSCGSVGNCVAYANEGMARGLFYGLLSLIITSMVLFYLSMLAYRRNARLRAERKAGRMGQKHAGSHAAPHSKR
ncbi:hypothetical protein HPB48_009938 [Haemaphysalis longicornis]|uniref:Organic anion transporter n=1 Tax=Haemaphysalis longicornis TaxID=44386 RepID=A0A9J6GLA8_HAELO|nr:hypothetical protein HPB48_009938 [Haemaphysalis longicornis]